MNAQGTSFIPQRPIGGDKSAPRGARKIYVLAYLSYVLFFGSIIAAAGVFFIQFSLDRQLEARQATLAAAKTQFNQADIESIRDLEKRMNIAKERLNNHVSVLSIFEALEASAIPSIFFNSFTYQRQGDDFPLVTFSGDSSQFGNVLFQREAFDSNQVLAGATFKEVTMQTLVSEDNPIDRNELVKFTLEKEVDTTLIGYTPRQDVPAPQQDASGEELQENAAVEVSDEAQPLSDQASSTPTEEVQSNEMQ